MSAAERTLAVLEAHPDELLVVVGPTASGKTALAVEVCGRVGGEIVSADSVQVYRHFDVGSGKPTPVERARAPHHMVDLADPLKPLEAATWAAAAERAIGEIRARGRVPVVCGGTFLWVKALLFGLAAAPGASDEVRARLAAVVDRAELHARLAAVDPLSARRLHPNDRVRVTRALEVWETTGKPMSAWQAEHGFARPRFAARMVALDCDKTTLSERIVARTRRWLASGWIEEVELLRARGYDGARAMSSVGYAQVKGMLVGELSRIELEARIVSATKVFARRQRTWLNHAEVTWVGDQSSPGT